MPTESLETLAGAVDSFEKLEIVCLLSREGAALPTSDIASALGLPPEIVRDAGRALAIEGLVREDADGWRIDVTSSRIAAVRALVALYTDDRLIVLNWMTKVSIERIRAGVARAFSDAFIVRLRKKGDDDG